MGFKAPLAYSSSFYFVCRKDGMERKYMMYEGEDTNTIDLLYEKSTNERNGVKVIVPIKYGDKHEFIHKVDEQLAYFENVYFDVPGGVGNDFQIVRSEHFQWSPLSKDSKMHICLDNVYYPLEFDKVGIKDAIYFPIGLRFNLTDGIFPTPNRESIRYTKEAKDIILKKISTVADYFIDKYNESILETNNVIEIMNYYSQSSRYLTFDLGKHDVSPLEKFATKKIAQPKLKGINILNLQLLHRNKNYILNEYQIKFRIDHGKFRECKRYWDQDLKIDNMTKDKHFIFEEKISGKKKDYLRETLGTNTTYGNYRYFIKKVRTFTLGKTSASTNYETYMDILGLRNIQRHLWRAAIKEFQSIVGMYINDLKKVEDIEIPQDWIDKKKKPKVSITTGGTGQRKVKLQGEIVVKLASTLERYVDGKHCKWVPTTYKLEELHKKSYLTVYGSQVEADIKAMNDYFNITNNSKIKFVAVSEREMKHLEKIQIHNWIKLDKFMEGNNKPFKRLVSAYLISNLMYKYRSTFDKIERLEDLSKDLVEKLKSLEQYKNNHFINANHKVYEPMVALAEEKNLFDGEIYYIYNQVKNFLDKCSFIKPLCEVMPYRRREDDKYVDIMRDMLKYYKQRLDWKNYNIKLNDEVVEQPIVEEDIQELA